MWRTCFTTGWSVLAVVAATDALIAAPQRNPEIPPLRCAEESRKRLDSEAVSITGDIEPPKKLVDASPDYPEPPPGTIFSGIWIGEALVGSDGLVVDAWALREPKIDPPFPQFNDAILEAIKKWEYEPVTVGDERVPVCMVVTVIIDVR
jgi:hypothetical protein